MALLPTPVMASAANAAIRPMKAAPVRALNRTPSPPFLVALPFAFWMDRVRKMAMTRGSTEPVVMTHAAVAKAFLLVSGTAIPPGAPTASMAVLAAGTS